MLQSMEPLFALSTNYGHDPSFGIIYARSAGLKRYIRCNIRKITIVAELDRTRNLDDTMWPGDLSRNIKLWFPELTLLCLHLDLSKRKITGTSLQGQVTKNVDDLLEAMIKDLDHIELNIELHSSLSRTFIAPTGSVNVMKKVLMDCADRKVAALQKNIRVTIC